MTALEESKIRIKVYKELTKSFKDIFSSSANEPLPPELASVYRYLDGSVKIENEITERFKTYGKSTKK